MHVLCDLLDVVYGEVLIWIGFLEHVKDLKEVEPSLFHQASSNLIRQCIIWFLGYLHWF